MRAWVAAGLLSLSLLAGCTGGGGGGEEDGGTDFSGLDLEVSETTGAIRGVVVDERIVPVPDADVLVRGANVERTTQTDEQGRFVFSSLPAGTYFLEATSLLHQMAQTSVEVVAGVAEPPVTKLLAARLFTQEPFVEQFKVDGFIQCNQAGVVYGSAPCITDFTGQVSGPLNGTGPCTPSGCAPQLRRVLTEQRGFRTSVGPGWQLMLLEMTWSETSDTFEEMGITFSYNETQRPASHWYARSQGTSPIYMPIRAGVVDETHQDEPEMIPVEGHPDLYFFVGVRGGGAPVALAVNQPFQLFTTWFYYGLPPEGWSVVNGDPLPF